MFGDERETRGSSSYFCVDISTLEETPCDISKSNFCWRKNEERCWKRWKEICFYSRRRICYVLMQDKEILVTHKYIQNRRRQNYPTHELRVNCGRHEEAQEQDGRRLAMLEDGRKQF